MNEDYVLMKKTDRDSIVTFLAGLQVVPIQAHSKTEKEAPAIKDSKPVNKDK